MSNLAVFSCFLDTDECQIPGACPTGVCTNTEGSFSCTACDLGFTAAPSGLSCEGALSWALRCCDQSSQVLWDDFLIISSTVVWPPMLKTQHSQRLWRFWLISLKALQLVSVWHADDVWIFLCFCQRRCEWMRGQRAVSGRSVHQHHRLLQLLLSFRDGAGRWDCLQRYRKYDSVNVQRWLAYPDLCAFMCLCADIDECLTTVGLCGEGDCLNTEGSYMCICPKGYTNINERTGCEGTSACSH